MKFLIRSGNYRNSSTGFVYEQLMQSRNKKYEKYEEQRRRKDEKYAEELRNLR
jgi:hypothetical protein